MSLIYDKIHFLSIHSSGILTVTWCFEYKCILSLKIHCCLLAKLCFVSPLSAKHFSLAQQSLISAAFVSVAMMLTIIICMPTATHNRPMCVCNGAASQSLKVNRKDARKMRLRTNSSSSLLFLSARRGAVRAAGGLYFCLGWTCKQKTRLFALD